MTNHSHWRHLPRFCVPDLYYQNSLDFILSEPLFKHAIQACRMRVGDQFIAFRGCDNDEYLAEITEIKKNKAQARWLAAQQQSRESERSVHLVMSVIASDKMDLVVQKATELGVRSIQPVMTAHAFRIAKEKWAHKQAHWHDVMASACEQCGRNQLPVLHPICAFNDYAALTHHEGQYWMCSPHATMGIRAMCDQQPEASSYSIWIGSEGGLSLEEEQLLKENGWHAIGLGQRILRAETAALAALSVLLLP